MAPASDHPDSGEEIRVESQSNEGQQQRTASQPLTYESVVLPIAEEDLVQDDEGEGGASDTLKIAKTVNNLRRNLLSNALELDQQPAVSDATVKEDIYIQQDRGFRKATRAQIQQYLALLAELEQEETGEEFGFAGATRIAQKVSKTFAKIVRILQGALAGFACFHAMAALWLTENRYATSLIKDIFSPLVMPLHLFYYVALVVCLVGALDRLDPSEDPKRFLFRAATAQSAGITIVLYAAALCLNCSYIPVDQTLQFSLHNTTAIYAASSDLHSWATGLTAKAALAFLAWSILALRPLTNQLNKSIVKTILSDKQLVTQIGDKDKQTTRQEVIAETT